MQQFYTSIKKKNTLSKYVHYVLLLTMLHATFIAPAQNIVEAYFNSKPYAAYYGLQYPVYLDSSKAVNEETANERVMAANTGEATIKNRNYAKAPQKSYTRFSVKADIESGFIGVSKERPLDDPSDNLFKFQVQSVPAGAYKAYLTYELNGVQDNLAVSRSINERIATGGYVVKSQMGWTTQKEEISLNWLRKGENHIMFSIPRGSLYQYQVKNVKIAFEPVENNKVTSLLSVSSSTINYIKDNTIYVRGFLKNVGSKSLVVYADNDLLKVNEGEFEGIIKISEAQKARKFLVIKAQDENGFLGQEILSLDTLVEADKVFPIESYEQKMTQFFDITKEGKLATDGASILVKANALTQAKALTLLKLRNVDIAPLGSGMINVTKGGYGYRFLPDGTTFEKPLPITIAYDEKLIPKGYTTKDIKTFYFDTHSKSWVAVKRDSIDEKEKMIISQTNHFTDYINGIIQTPESPETAGFTPTMMNDIKAADPSSEMTIISPPEVSQKGDANVSYPIKIPAGRKGMQPQVAIQYNSDGGNGWLGEGWGISTPAITIDTRWGVPQFDAQNESEIYSLAGEQLMYPKLGDSDWMPNRHYDVTGATNVYNTAPRPRITAAIFTPRKQGSFSKIERLGTNPNDYYWKVTSTDGTISWYGGKDGVNENAVIRNDAGKIVHWALHKVEDVHHNNMIYKYESNILTGLSGNNANLNGGKTYNLFSIHYTGYNDDFGDYKVEFENENQILRKDISLSSRLGYKEVNPYRLKKIHVSYQGDIIRTYNLNYEEGPFSKSLLKEVEELDNSGISFYKHTFEYYDDINSREKGGILFDQPYTVTVPSINPNFTLGIGNLLNASRINAQENVEAEWGISPTAGIDLFWVSSNPASIFTVGAPFGESTSWGKGKISLNDMDGNGLDDVVYKTNSGLKFLPHYVDGNNNHYFDSNPKNILNINNFEKSEGWTKTMFGESWELNALYKFYAGTKRFKSSNKTTTYFTDGNGDGLPDVVVDDKVYFNHIDQNTGDAVFGTGSDVTPNMVITASPAEIKADDVPDDNPEAGSSTDYDIVRVWQAPRSGIITIEDVLQFVPDGTSKLIYSIETDGNRKIANGNPFRIYLKQFNQADTTETIFLDDYFGNNPPLGLSWNGSLGTHSGIYVLPGQRFYFRVHRNKIGKNDVLNTNPRIKYVTQQGSYNNLVPQVLLDDNYLDINNADYQESFILSDIQNTEVTKNGNVSITWPQINVHNLSDEVTFKIIKRVTGANSNVSNEVIYEQICPQGNVTTLVDDLNNPLSIDLQSIPVTETDETHKVEFLFQVQSDSNVKWKDIEWKPKFVFTAQNTQDNFEKYPVPDYDIYQTLIHRLDLNPTLSACTFDYNAANNTNFGDFNNNFQAGWPNSGVQTYSVFPNTHLINTGANAQLTANDSGNFMLVVKKEGITIGKIKVVVSGGQVHMSSNQTLPIPVFTGNLSDPNLQIPKISLQYIVQGENNLKVFQKYSHDVANENPYAANVCEGNVIIALGNSCSIDAQGNVTPPIDDNYTIYKRIFAGVLVKKDPIIGPQYRSWGQFMYNGSLDSNNAIPSDTYGKLINTGIVENPYGNTINFMATGLGIQLSNCDNADPAVAELCALNAINATLNLPQQSSITSANVELIVNQLMLNPALSSLANVQPAIVKMNASRKIASNGISYVEKWIGFHDAQYSSPIAMRDGNLSNAISGGPFDDPNDPETTILQGNLYTGMNSLVKDHRSVTRSYSAGWGSTNFSHSQSSYSNDVTDFVDVNGDRYPDLLSTNSVQTSNMTGGHRGSKPHGWSISESDSFNSSITKSKTYTIPGRQKADDDAESDDEGNPAARVTLGLTANLAGKNKEKSYWMDLNGDGLVDKVVSNNGFKFILNNGNITNLTAGQQNFSNLNSSENRPSTLAANIGIPITNQGSGSFSFSLSAGIGASAGDADVSFQDLNGDGLVDMLEVSNQVAKVRYNTGNGFSDTQYTLSVVDYTGRNLNRNYSGSLSGSISYFYGFSICCWIIPIIYLKFGGTASGSVSLTVSDTQKSFRDFNGDGFVDYVERDGTNLKVYPSNIRRTNKLKTVFNPLGGSFTMDYKSQKTDYNNPNSKWAMSSLVINDGYNLVNDGKDVYRKDFAYENGKYDRREREFYGYETVKQMDSKTDSNNATTGIYRTTVSKYHNQNYFLNGMLKETYVLKGTDENMKFSRTENFYDILKLNSTNSGFASPQVILPNTFDVGGTEGRRSAAVILSKTKNYLYELAPTPQLTTQEEMIYDNKGRVVQYVNKGDITTTSDDYNSYITYQNIPSLVAKNMIRLPETITVKIGTTEMRKRKATVDATNGNVLSITAVIDSANNAITNLYYDTYGNLTSIHYPTNANGQNMVYDYTYDPNMHKFLIAIKDSFGYGSSATYNPLFDKITETIDLTGNKMQYEYDSFGRNTIIRSPKEIAANKPYSIKFEYYPNYSDLAGSGITLDPAVFVPVALTKHYDLQHPLNDIETYTFIDGLGRPIQVKKDIEINTGTNLNPTLVEAMSFTGKAMYDEFGRATKQFHPYYEIKNSTTNFKINEYLSTYFATSEYDEIDRVTKTIDPENNVSLMQYSIANDVSNVLAIKTKSTVQQNALNNVVTETYKDTSGRVISTKNVGPNGDIWTQYSYNAIGELLSYTDAENISTAYTYDLLGRKKSVNHPDNGLTTYQYDNASNLITLQTANLAADSTIPAADRFVKYQYNYNRLEGVTYPPTASGANISDVVYKFGDPGSGNQTGRLVYQQDATGTQTFTYGNMGELDSNQRIVVGPNIPTRVFNTYYSYDSWNRLLRLEYPDGERVTYTYNLGGNLISMKGNVNGAAYNYIKRIDYDHYEQRTYLKYGNNTETSYTYSPALRRLSNLNVKTSSAQNLFNNNYQYDKVGNVTSITNTAGLVGNNMGGTYAHNFGYDILNRLAWAKGNFTGSSTQAVDANDYYSDYDLEMTYNNTHGIENKNQNHFKNSSQYMPNTYQNQYKYLMGTHKVESINDGTTGYTEMYSYDFNGNTVAKTNSNDETRQFLWDEANRLRVVADARTMQHYIYDASGERVLKANSDVSEVYQNGTIVDQTNFTVNTYTTYPSAFLVIDPQGVYSKHYFAGSQRVVSRIGESSISIFDYACANCKTAEGKGLDEKALKQTQVQDLQQRLRKKGYGIAVFKKFEAVSYSDVVKEMNATEDDEANRPGPAAPPPPIYYYHPDHLGTSTFLTDANGNAYQFFLNLPFGETMAEQRGSQYYQTPYKFNGKELDEETGLYYYGARYYDPKASIWLSVDPLAEKYKNINPYVYCIDNPLSVIDPDGMDIIFLNASNAVGGLGHGAVLIGNDKDGWRYLSMNGTGEGSSPFGRSKNADLGNIKASWNKSKKRWEGNDFRGTGLTAKQLLSIVNKSNPKETHEYDRSVRIKTSSFEDNLAYQAAYNQASLPDYNIFGSSCVDVPQEAFEVVVANRLNNESKKDPYFWDDHLSWWDANSYGFHLLAPNDWYNALLSKSSLNNFMDALSRDLKNDFKIKDGPDDFKEVSSSPRYF